LTRGVPVIFCDFLMYLPFSLLTFFFFFFFFQAEDGIRDFHVTGVQTCALPISSFASSQTRTRSAVLLDNGGRPATTSVPKAPLSKCRTTDSTCARHAASCVSGPGPLITVSIDFSRSTIETAARV